MATDFVASPTHYEFPSTPLARNLSPPNPLSLVQDEDPDIINLANKKLRRRSRLSRIFPFRSRSKSSLSEAPESTTSFSSTESLEVEVTGHDNWPINLDNSTLIGEKDIYADRYEWAVVYENQRGLTFFSIPYYSSLSLLPSDPAPFTLPNSSLKRSKQPPITLEKYPLPDGNWKWVSRCWMIDMRTDSGEVQHDGFEYNWIFRRHDWRAQIGSFNAGGWVRRRRWIRLMVCPGKPKPANTDSSGTSLVSPNSTRASDKRHHRYSMASFPPSVNTNLTDISTTIWPDIDPDEVWMGNTEEDWRKCRSLMKQFVRDGRKLELWKLWLGFYHPEHKQKFLSPDDKGKRRDKQWTEDDGPMPSELAAADILSREWVSVAPRQPVLDVLQKYGQDILHLFIFPESRVQFLTLLAQTGLLLETNIPLGSSDIDFWSYASDLGTLVHPSYQHLAETQSTSSQKGADLSKR